MIFVSPFQFTKFSIPYTILSEHLYTSNVVSAENVEARENTRVEIYLQSNHRAVKNKVLRTNASAMLASVRNVVSGAAGKNTYLFQASVSLFLSTEGVFVCLSRSFSLAVFLSRV